MDFDPNRLDSTPSSFLPAGLGARHEGLWAPILPPGEWAHFWLWTVVRMETARVTCGAGTAATVTPGFLLTSVFLGGGRVFQGAPTNPRASKGPGRGSPQ